MDIGRADHTRWPSHLPDGGVWYVLLLHRPLRARYAVVGRRDCPLRAPLALRYAWYPVRRRRDRTTSLRRPASLYCHIRHFSAASYHHPFCTTAGQKIFSISAIFLPTTLCSWEETRHRRTEDDSLGDGGDDREDHRLHGPVQGGRSAARGDDGESLQGTGGISRVSNFLSATTPSLTTAVEGRACPPLSCF